MGYNIVNTTTDLFVNDTGIGVKYPFNGPGVFSKVFTTLEQGESNLRCLLLTRKGERYLQPLFGTDLLYLLFEPNITELKDEISDTITDAVSYWLPYIIITKLDVISQEDDPNLIHTVKISINFNVTGVDQDKTITIFANEDGVIQVE
tara:strand:+ start:189 stop:632 length:444 start_codon:yes stop_codon:yes gene_type:complete